MVFEQDVGKVVERPGRVPNRPVAVGGVGLRNRDRDHRLEDADEEGPWILSEAIKARFMWGSQEANLLWEKSRERGDEEDRGFEHQLNHVEEEEDDWKEKHCGIVCD